MESRVKPVFQRTWLIYVYMTFTIICACFFFSQKHKGLHKYAVDNRFNPFQHDKILDQTKLKAFADDKLNVTKIIISVFDRVENIVGKGEIACTSNFSFSHNVFNRVLSQGRQKVSLCGNALSVAEEH